MPTGVDGNGAGACEITYARVPAVINNFKIQGDTGTPQTITNNNTISILGGDGISTVASATDTITIKTTNSIINTAINQISTTATYTLYDTDWWTFVIADDSLRLVTNGNLNGPQPTNGWFISANGFSGMTTQHTPQTIIAFSAWNPGLNSSIVASNSFIEDSRINITVSAPAEAVLGNYPVYQITVVKTDIGNNTVTPRVMTTVEISNF